MDDKQKLQAKNKLNDVYFNQIKKFYVQKYAFPLVSLITIWKKKF